MIIEVNKLTHEYGNAGIHDVSFEVNKGEVFGYLGPNGAGKSTTMRHLMGFSKPESGYTKILGMDSYKCHNEIMNHVGYLPGEVALPELLYADIYIDIMKEFYAIKNNDRINYLINLFELDPKQKIKRMSIGEKRKLAIVLAFMNDPEVLLLDEPTSGLDPKMQEVFIEFIKSEKRRGKTIIISSHLFNEVEVLCDKVAIIKEGRIVALKEMDDVKKYTNKNYIISFKDSNFNDYVNLNKFEINYINNCEVSISLNDNYLNDLISEVSHVNINGIKEEHLSLEDYFMQFYKDKGEACGRDSI